MIKHYGGVYIDFTTLLTQSLDWVLELPKLKMVENKWGEYPDVFLSYNSKGGQYDNYFDKRTNQKVWLNPAYENSFIAGRPGSKFLQEWFDMYVYGKNETEKKFPGSKT